MYPDRLFDELVALARVPAGGRILGLADRTRHRLFELIHRRVEAQPTRTVSKTYLATLTVAPRL